MTGHSHLLFGTALGTALALNVDNINAVFPHIANSPENATLLIFGGIIGSVLPDLDASTSYVAKLASPMSRLLKRLNILLGKDPTRHRGFLHDIGICLIGLLLSVCFFPPLLGLFFGLLSHLYLDAYNQAGISVLFGVRWFRFANIPSTGKGSEFFCRCNAVAVLLLGLLHMVV